MTTIVTRAGKGSPLTNVEVDANFTNLNNDKLENTGGTITANSSSAALKITQTGTGNALVVEDAASDTTPFVIDPSGKVIVGHTAEVTGAYGDYATLLNIGTGFIARQFNHSYSADSFAPVVEFGKSRSATAGAHTVVTSDDELGTLRFAGSDGTAFKEAARIQAIVDGTPGTNYMPCRLVFSTTADGAYTPTERMRIDSAGNVGIGGVASGGKLHVFGANDAVVVAEGQSGYGAFYAKGSGTNNSYMFFGNGGGEKGRITVTNTGDITFHTTTSSTERLRINSDGHIFQTASGPYVGMFIRNTSGSGSAVSHGFVDFQNELGITTGSVLNLQATDGSSRIDFLATPSGARNSDRRAVVFQVYGNGNALAISPNGGLGYGAGAGGTVTQATSKSTPVTLNKPTGQITMHNAALAAGASVVFVVNNSLVTTSDLVVVGGANAGVDPLNYRIETARANGNGVFAIIVTNISARSLSEALKIQFSVIKGAIA